MVPERSRAETAGDAVSALFFSPGGVARVGAVGEVGAIVPHLFYSPSTSQSYGRGRVRLVGSQVGGVSHASQ